MYIINLKRIIVNKAYIKDNNKFINSLLGSINNNKILQSNNGNNKGSRTVC